jgi:transposase, IS30 family
MEALLKAGHNQTMIATILSIHKLTVSRELQRSQKQQRKRYGKQDRRGCIPNRISIDKRLSFVDRKSRIGDWEGDTIIGKGHQGLVTTHIERKIKYQTR